MAVMISDRLLESGDRLLDAESDDQLVSLVQTGHEAAFAGIVRRYERELQAHARRLSSDGRAEDAVQQAFLNAFASMRGGSEVRHLRGWLHQILRHEVSRAREPIDAPLEATVACGETLEDTVARRATAHEALAELSALPERQRDALLGTAVLGFPRAQVARTMGLSEGAVRQLVHRARLRMRQAATALIPFPLVRFFGAARSGVDANPDVAVGTAASASAAASGGLAIKIGGLLASGVLATGIAVTHTSPSHHHGATAPARHHLPQAGATRHVSPISAASAAPVFTSDPLRADGQGTAAVREDGHGHDASGRPSGVRSGRHGGPGSGRESGRGHDGSPAVGGDGGSGRSPGGSPSRGDQGGGSGSGTSAGSGSSSGSGSASSGEGSGGGSGGHHGGSGSSSGSATGSAGSGSGKDAASSDDGHGAGPSSGGAGASATDSDADASSSPGSSGSATAATGAGSTGDDAGSGSGQDQGSVVSLGSDGSQTPSSGSGSGSGGGKENLRGARDVSGSLDSSSS